MKLKHILFFIGLIWNTTSLVGQLNKGSWMVNGQFSFINYLDPNEFVEGTDILINPQISLMITPGIMVGGQLSIRIFDERTIIRNTLEVRHYFKQFAQSNLFYGLSSSWEKDQYLVTVPNSRIFKYSRHRLLFGADIFLNKNIAIEPKFDYLLLSLAKRQSSDPWSHQPGLNGISFSLGIQFFFGSQLAADSISERIVFEKGLWLIEGRTMISDQMGRVNEAINNQLTPAVAFFVRNNLAIGMQFKYIDKMNYRFIDFRFNPFLRYYLHVNVKRKIFTEIKTGYGFSLLKTSLRNHEIINEALSYGLAIGWVTMLSKYTSFDITAGYYNETDNKGPLPNPRLKIGIGLQAFLSRK